MKINQRYVPTRLTKKDKYRQLREIIKSRKLYKNKIYHSRPNLKSFTSKKSPHVLKAMKMYNVKSVRADNKLSKATGCSKQSLKKIINKGAGAYYSSGSRPNQSAQSWGVARLASAITSGKAAAVDYAILEEGCSSKSKALKLAKKAVEKYGHGTRKARKIVL
jgi:hypothetical protein